jgi:hypothetical protein
MTDYELITKNFSLYKITSISVDYVTFEHRVHSYTIPIWKFKQLRDYWNILGNSKQYVGHPILENDDDDNITSDLKFTLTKPSDVRKFYDKDWMVESKSKDRTKITLVNVNDNSDKQVITWWDFWLKLNEETKQRIIKATNNNALIEKIKKKPKKNPDFISQFENLKKQYLDATKKPINYGQLQVICRNIVKSEYTFRKFASSPIHFTCDPFEVMYEELFSNAIK